MMIGMYTIKDTVAEEFGEPFLAKNQAIAVRSYHLALAKVDPILKRDYQLYYVGDFDNFTGRILNVDDFTLISTTEEEVVNENI